MKNEKSEPIIEIKNLTTKLGGDTIHENLNMTVYKGEVVAIVGGSGSGKTTLLRQMLNLIKPSSGSIKIFGIDITKAKYEELLAIQQRWGVLFQQSALFSSLTVLENTAFPLIEHTTLDKKTLKKLSLLKILLAGLPEESANKYPSELSGGMVKRAGVARAIAMDPELLFLDEPTSGLDPVNAASFDELILDLTSTMGLTVVMVTHDLDSLWHVADRVAFLGEGKVLAIAPMVELMKNPHPLIQEFFNGPRGKVAQKGYEDDGH